MRDTENRERERERERERVGDYDDGYNKNRKKRIRTAKIPKEDTFFICYVTVHIIEQQKHQQDQEQKQNLDDHKYTYHQQDDWKMNKTVMATDHFVSSLISYNSDMMAVILVLLMETEEEEEEEAQDLLAVTDTSRNNKYHK